MCAADWTLGRWSRRLLSVSRSKLGRIFNFHQWCRRKERLCAFMVGLGVVGGGGYQPDSYSTCLLLREEFGSYKYWGSELWSQAQPFYDQTWPCIWSRSTLGCSCLPWVDDGESFYLIAALDPIHPETFLLNDSTVISHAPLFNDVHHPSHIHCL